MHIPDGYISPQTSITFWAAILPLWSIALNKIKASMNHKLIPKIALCSAFSFIIMMFNIPMGASSVHATGAVLIAILVGPWAASISISVALGIQALIFGDGGIWTLAANCFNIAFAMPFSGYYLYKFLNGNAKFSSKRNTFSIFIAGFAGINVAALLTAVEFGIQPHLFKDAMGLPAYGYFPLSIAVPVIMLEHLLVAGPVEGIISVIAFRNLYKFNPEMLEASYKTEKDYKSLKKTLILLLGLLILSPLGLLATGTAWGEWSKDELRNMIGFIPSGMENIAEKWNTVFTDYTIPYLNDSFFHNSIGYIFSGIIGCLLILILMLVANKFAVKEPVTKDLEKA